MTDQNQPPVGPPVPPAGPPAPVQPAAPGAPVTYAAPVAGAPAAAAPNRTKLIVTIVIIGVVILGLAIAAAAVAFNLVAGAARPGGETPPAAGSGGGSEEEPEAAETVTYTSSTFGYTVEFLGEPEEQSATQSVAGQEIEQIQAAYASGDTYMSAATNTFPEGLLEQAGSTDVILENSVNGMVAAIPGAEVIESHDSTLDGEQSVAGSVDVGNGQVMSFVISIHDGVQYLLLSSGLDEAAHTSFVESFAFGA